MILPAAVGTGILLSVSGDSPDETPAEGDTSGLGQAVDEYVDLSPFLREELEKLRADGWNITYGPLDGAMRGLAFPGEKKILIDDGLESDPRKALAALSHEVGHVYPGKYSGNLGSPTDGESYAHWMDRSLNEFFKGEAESEFVQARVRQEIIENGGPDIGAPHELINSLYEKDFDGLTRERARELVAESTHLWEGWWPHYEPHLRQHWDDNFADSHGPSTRFSSLKELEERTLEEDSVVPEYPPVPHSSAPG